MSAYDFGDGTWGWECQKCGTICGGQPLPIDPSDWAKGFSNGITSPEQAAAQLAESHRCRALAERA